MTINLRGNCPVRRPSTTFVSVQRWSISPTRNDQQHHQEITGHRRPSIDSRTGWSRSGLRQNTRGSDVFTLQGWYNLGLGRHIYRLVISQQPVHHQFEPLNLNLIILNYLVALLCTLSTEIDIYILDTK